MTKRKLKNILNTTLNSYSEQKENTDKAYVKAYCQGVIDICKELLEELK